MTANVSVGNTTGLYIGSGAVQVLNSAGQLLAILSNSASIGFNYGNAGNTTVTAQVLGSGVTAGAYGNAAYYPTFTVGTDGRLTAAGAISLSAVTGTYGNANVAAYLPTDPNINAIWSNIALTNANLGAFEIYANATFSSSSYGNANVSAYLPTDPNVIAIWGNINSINANLGSYQTYANANAASQATSINTITANLGAYQTYANANASSQATSINTINANLGAFETYANLTFGTSNYGNANVAAYLPVFGGNILAGNIDIPYTSGTRNRGQLAIGGNVSQYDSGVIVSLQGNEATYLYTSLQNTNGGATAYSSYALNDDTHTYYGELGINSSTYNYATAGYPDNAFSKPLATFLQSTGANLAIGTYGNFGINFVVNGGTVAADAMTIANNGNVTVVGNLTAGGTTTLANVKSTNGYFWANGTAYSTGGASTYGNTQVAAYLPTFTGNVGAGNLVLVDVGNSGLGGNILGSNVTIRATGNTAATYLNITTGGISTTSSAYSKGIIQITAGGEYGGGLNSLITLSAQSLPSTINMQAPGNLRISNTPNTQILGNTYIIDDGAGTNGNLFVQKQIFGTGNITSTGNVISTGGYYWANGVSYATTVTGTYSNSNVASYLPTYSGNFGNYLSVGSSINIGGYTQVLLNSQNSSVGVYQGQVIISTPSGATNYTAFNSNVTLYGLNQGYLTVGNTATVGNILSTGGYFWANGTAYSTPSTYGNTQVAAYLLAPGPIGSGTPNTGTFSTLTVNGNTTTGNLTTTNTGTFNRVFTTAGVYWTGNGAAYSTGTAFTGDLAGSILDDSTNNRIFANAYPLSTPTGTWQGNIFVNQIAVKPSYTGTVLNATSGAQTAQVVSEIISANLNIATRSGTTTSTIGTLAYMQAWPNSATMNANDRVRALSGIAEVNLNAGTWGTLAAAGANVSTAVGTSGLTQIVGTGGIGAAAGVLGAIINIPVSGSANIQYATNFLATTTYNLNNTPSASNISYARMLGGTVTASGVGAIYNAVGLHTQQGWATATNRYVVLNEDTTSTIQTNGNIGVTGNLKMQAYQETVYATGFTGGAWTVAVNNGTVQSATLTSSISSLSFTGMPAGGSVTLIITQGGSGSYTLTTTGIKYAGGSSTLSTAVGAIDILNILFDGTTYYASLVKGYA